MAPEGHALLFIAIGALFLAGLAADAFGRRLSVPRVSLLILLGVAAGPAGLDWLPPALTGSDGPYADVALTMVAFLLGGGLTKTLLHEHGRQIVIVSIVVVLAALAVVSTGLWLAGVPAALALALAGIASATDPAATREVIVQTGADTPFARRLLGIVAVDDAWGVIAFSLSMAAVGLLSGSEPPAAALVHGMWEVVGALGLGAAIGLPAAQLTGRLKPGEPTLLEAVGIVFLAAGLAMWAGVSTLLTGMACGAVVTNLARHHEQPFHEIERIEWPFMLLFFVMAGASLRLDALTAVGALGAGYALLRIASRIAGGWAAGHAAGLGGRTGTITGLALMPQAGVAIGMALVAGERLPGQAETILAIAVATTIVFEVAGPLATQVALRLDRGRENTAP